MKLKVNRFLLTQRSWDSGSLTPLASTTHCFKKTGKYQIIVLISKKEEQIGVIDLVVDDKAPETQVNIDLDAISRGGLSQNGIQKPIVANPRKHILFYTSRGSESYSVVAYEEGTETKVFDSRELHDEDVFIVNPLASGLYSIAGSNKGKGEIVINKREGRSVPTRGIVIECTDEGFKPDKLKTDFLQPLFFMIRTRKPSRIKVQLEKREGNEKQGSKLSKSKRKKS